MSEALRFGKRPVQVETASDGTLRILIVMERGEPFRIIVDATGAEIRGHIPKMTAAEFWDLREILAAAYRSLATAQGGNRAKR